MNGKEFLKLLVSLVYPNRCAGCGELIEYGKHWCDSCLSSLEFIPSPVCSGCGMNKEECKCKPKEAHDWESITAPFYYDGVVRNAIFRFKFRGKSKLSLMFAEYMVKSLEIQLPGKQFDTVACVPMSKKGRRERGYNQSELLARDVAKLLDVEFNPDLLRKVRKTETQHSLPSQQRAGNVFGAYEVSKDISLDGKIILLCDDIKTTGSTLAECCRMLKLSGAKEVCCVCAAVTPDKEKVDK